MQHKKLPDGMCTVVQRVRAAGQADGTQSMELPEEGKGRKGRTVVALLQRLGMAAVMLALVTTLSADPASVADAEEAAETSAAVTGQANALGTIPIDETQRAAYREEFNALQRERGFYSDWSLEERAQLSELKLSHGVVQWYDSLDGLPGPDSMAETEAIAMAEKRVLSAVREGGIPMLSREKLDNLFERRVYYKTYQVASANPVWWVQYWIKDPNDFYTEPYVDGVYVVPEDKTEIYAMHMAIDARTREVLTDYVTSTAEMEASVEIDEILRVLELELGWESDWTVEQRAEFVELQHERGDGSVWPDGLPGETDLTMEEAFRIAAEAVAREFDLSAEDLQRFAPHAFFWPDFNIITEDGDQWQGNMWNIIYEAQDQADIDAYESIYVRVYSPSGEVIETFATIGSNG